MDILPLAPTGQPPPTHVADLRPVAGAAALARDPRGAGAAASVLPAPVTQIAEVSRSLIASTADEAPAALARAERVLRPWGVAMLPATPDDDPGKPATARDKVPGRDRD